MSTSILNIIKYLAILFALSGLVSCGTTTQPTTKYSHMGYNTPLQGNQAVAQQVQSGVAAAVSNSPTDTARLEFVRTDDWLYLALDAVVKIDNREVRRIGRGTGFFVNVQPGFHEIRINASMNPGSSVIRADFKAGGKYSFQIAPNSGVFGMGAIQLSTIGGSSSNSGLFGISLMKAIEPKEVIKPVAAPTQPAQKSIKIDLQKAKAECEDIGFTPKTSEFGNCVLELTK